MRVLSKGKASFGGPSPLTQADHKRSVFARGMSGFAERDSRSSRSLLDKTVERISANPSTTARALITRRSQVQILPPLLKKAPLG